MNAGSATVNTVLIATLMKCEAIQTGIPIVQNTAQKWKRRTTPLDESNATTTFKQG